jgi:hypothetical protein
MSRVGRNAIRRATISYPNYNDWRSGRNSLSQADKKEWPPETIFVDAEV